MKMRSMYKLVKTVMLALFATKNLLEKEEKYQEVVKVAS
ncbi:hypothetical protein C2W64_04416 [Brevibacillus laterosporus]|nr:hypothetical protein C2W64_04416 [Brevibacillus laterosporus]